MQNTNIIGYERMYNRLSTKSGSFLCFRDHHHACSTRDEPSCLHVRRRTVLYAPTATVFDEERCLELNELSCRSTMTLHSITGITHLYNNKKFKSPQTVNNDCHVCENHWQQPIRISEHSLWESQKYSFFTVFLESQWIYNKE